jgi:hypothetical protein
MFCKALSSTVQPSPKHSGFAPPPQLVRLQNGLHTNLRVPESSAISKAFFDPFRNESNGIEDLGQWGHSDGSALPPLWVRVEARRLEQFEKLLS